LKKQEAADNLGGSMGITLFQGADAIVRVNLRDKKTGDLYDLSGFSGATAYFDQESSDEPLAVTGGVEGSEDTGRLVFEISESDTALMEAVDAGSMEVVLDQGSKRTVVQFDGQVTVKSRLF
jgi:hypothetical protein